MVATRMTSGGKVRPTATIQKAVASTGLSQVIHSWLAIPRQGLLPPYSVLNLLTAFGSAAGNGRCRCLTVVSIGNIAVEVALTILIFHFGNTLLDVPWSISVGALL